jgi:hypothetical protein
MKPIFLKPYSDGYMLLAENKQFKTEMVLNALVLQTWEQYRQRVKWFARLRKGNAK